MDRKVAPPPTRGEDTVPRRGRGRGEGTVQRTEDGFSTRIRLSKSRPQFALSGCRTEEEAGERAKFMGRIARRLRRAGQEHEAPKLLELAGQVRAGKPLEAIEAAIADLCAGNCPLIGEGDEVPTFAAFAKQWTEGALAKKSPDRVRAKNSSRDEELLRIYINPKIGPIPVHRVTLAHCDEVMAALPSKLSGRTRRHVAQCLRRVMVLVVYPGKHRESSPIPRGWVPSVFTDKAKECLYPEEDAALLSHTATPFLRRLAYGILDREGMRVSELGRLRWRDVDLVRGRVRLDETKTDDRRSWKLRDDVVRALVAWRRTFSSDDDDAPIISEGGVQLDVHRLARRLRDDLQAAGVKRAELFERSAVRQPLRAHDLRSTFCTLSLATGKTETYVCDRTGWRSSNMVALYRRRAREWNEMQIGELGPLDALLPELAIGRAMDGGGSVHSARESVISESIRSVAPSGLEPERPCGPRILSSADAAEFEPREEARALASAGDSVSSPVAPARVHAGVRSLDSDEALRAAIKAAIDAGDFGRAERLLAVLKASAPTVQAEPPPGQADTSGGNVVPIAGRKRGAP